MTPLESAAAVVLLEFQQSYGLGFVAPNGRIVTCFHVVADEREITAHLADGRALPVRAVCALDLRRDLAVLDVGLLDATPVKAPSARLAEEGQKVFIFGMVSGEARARWVEATLASVQVVGATLSVYVLSGAIPPDASGGPLIGADGTALGVVTVAETDEGVATLAVPWRYVEPLLRQNQELPLSALSTEGKRPPPRAIPEHPLSLLNGSAVSGLEATSDQLGEAIRQGAPAYNEGDVAKCYAVYADAARRIINTRDDCPGVQTALRQGLERAARLQDVDHRAWAMRDAFDGLLMVIEKYLRARVGPGRKPGKPTLLN
ncbi:MAG: S1 family peptidase [Myxococcota bacterium]